MPKYCSACGNEVHEKAEICVKCGVRVAAPPITGGKSRKVAAVFAIFLGNVGAHKFYLGQPGWGILYILFCWTFIPAVIALIEGIVLLTTSDVMFNEKYNRPKNS